jgi:hypothetical protein
MVLSQTSPRVGGGEATLVTRIKIRSKIYLIVLGPGNVRWGTSKVALETSSILGVNSGIPQVNADRTVEREWQGELWVISDQPSTPYCVVMPVQEFTSQKGLQGVAG